MVEKKQIYVPQNSQQTKRQKTLETIAIIGSGSWGSAVAKIIGDNVKRKSHLFESKVRIWMRTGYEEFNREHQNKKYLPGVHISDNVVAMPDLAEVARGATVLVMVVPHQFLEDSCAVIRPVMAPNAKAISLIKGLEFSSSGPVLLSSIIEKALGIDCSVLMGANIANDVAKGKHSEATIGYKNKDNAKIYFNLFNTPTFLVSCVPDIPSIEICGALKNVIALAAGFCDASEAPGNTKAAVLRIGLLEMKKFSHEFFDDVQTDTFFESCGMADLFVTCLEGRNRKCAEAFIRTGKSFPELEAELLAGQKLQGTGTAKKVNKILVEKKMEDQFPLMSAVYRVAFDSKPVTEVTNALEAAQQHRMRTSSFSL